MTDDSEWVRKPPTISDVVKELTELVDEGFGDLPIEAIILPDATMAAISKSPVSGPDRAAIMELGSHGGRDPVLLHSATPVKDN